MVAQRDRHSGMDAAEQSAHLFSLNVSPDTSWGRATSRFTPMVERMLALDSINGVYDRVARGGPQRFVERVLEDLDVHYKVSDADLARIPTRGPLVVVANHPFGAIEGIILAVLLRRVRPDVRVMANYLLGRIPEMRDLFLCVDPFASEKSTSYNQTPIRQAMRFLRDGGALAVFPAGEVAHLDLRRRAIVEPHWNRTIAGMVRRTGASVIPVHFDGQNGPLFHVLGLVHPRLRTAMLPRQLMNKCGRTLHVRVGAAIQPKRMSAIGDDASLTDYLRQRMLLLAHRARSLPGPESHSAGPASVTAMQPIIEAVDPPRLALEVDSLPAGQLLVDGGEYKVYIAESGQIPCALTEIGRLREITYRATGEGTGKSSDLDEFDRHYQHLFLWHAATSEVAGAYRLGPTERIIASRGAAGLYTTTLFDFKLELLRKLTPALELGRAFVRPEHQRSYAPLLMLWKGLARYVSQRPRYKILFGPVSISNDYQSASRQLMVRFLRANHAEAHLSDLARPKNPFRDDGRSAFRNLRIAPDDIDDAVSELEPDRKGIPVLIRQYLKLGARFFSFNVDRDFGNAIDALMYVDLTRTDPRILARYMGRPATDQFRHHHNAT
jgi:putative hemolysin